MAVVAPLIGGAISLGSSLIGSANAQSQAAQASADTQQAVQAWLSINVPDPAQQAIELQNYQVTGQLSPQLQTAFQQSQTNLDNLNVPSTGRAAEVQALQQMQGLASNGGLDAQAEQQTQQAINQTNANTQGQIGAVVQNAASRGVGGSGAQLAAELEAAQGGANQAASGGLQAASGAEQRALQAIQGSSTAGNALNASDYAQAANAAEAQDAINRFNAQNSQATQASNVSSENAAQAANLANAQSVANANTGVANQEEVSNKALIQQQFQNQATVAGGETGALTGAASQANTNAKNIGSQASSIGQAASAGAGAIGQAYNNSNNSSNATNANNQVDNAVNSSANTVNSFSMPSLEGSPSTGPSLTSGSGDGYAHGGEVMSDSDFSKILAAAADMKRLQKYAAA